MLQFIVGQDGSKIGQEAEKFSLLPNEKKYSKRLKSDIFDFVGFVIDKEKLLAVFPKHFFEKEIENEIFKEKDINEDIILLFKVINKYVSEKKTNSVASKYIGYEENFESDYPFDAFFKVYEYYKKYGIYKEEEISIEQNASGKISWKDTIQKSNVIVSNGNLIFFPLYSKKKNNKNAFISECMTFVINYTIKNFKFFIELSPVKEKECKIDFLANREYTLRQLYQYRNTIFKDYQKELINSLIKFFEQYNKKANGGAIHFRINYFNLIWEDMVNKYLNDCFVSVDKENCKLIFDSNKKSKTKQFEDKKFNIDKSKHKFFIRPDHYYTDDNTMYVFDSKYYEDVSDLNYKQFSYTILLGNSQLGNNKNLYSALLLPGKRGSGLHLKLDIPYCQLNQGCNYIIEQFLNVRLLMKNYLNLDIKSENDESGNNITENYLYPNVENYNIEELKVAEDSEEYRYD